MAGAIRVAGSADLAQVAACVDAAFGPYAVRIGRPPAPMLVDHAAQIAHSRVFLLEEQGIAGVVVLEAREDCLFVETLAVDPGRRRAGLGRRLMAFAESEAVRQALPEVRLYTHEAMVESQAFYQALGYRERECRLEDGYARIYLAKRLVDFS